MSILVAWVGNADLRAAASEPEPGIRSPRSMVNVA